MTKGYRLLTGLLICSSLSSCFKDEPLNAEADITRVTFHLADPLGTFFNESDTLLDVTSTDRDLVVAVRRDHKVSLQDLQPDIAVTPGATLTETNVTADGQNSIRHNYTVTSEDGQYHRQYTLTIHPQVHTVGDTVRFDFEHFELDQQYHKYYVWHNVLHDGTLANDWANGNEGFMMSMGSAKPEDYPSSPLLEGYDGHALRLVTRDTGAFGIMAKKRLAAGSFFLGTFHVKEALLDAMRATHFGVPFDRQPIELTGYYRYTPGKTFQDKDGHAVEGRTDEGSIYAVLYRNHDDQGNAVTLYGNDVKTSPQIIAIADMGSVHATDRWVAFKQPFNYTSDIDYDLLANRGYNLAIVFSSSSEGDLFEGAIGSELCIDKVQVICKREE